MSRAGTTRSDVWNQLGLVCDSSADPAWAAWREAWALKEGLISRVARERSPDDYGNHVGASW
jgi:hypothetical protein